MYIFYDSKPTLKKGSLFYLNNSTLRWNILKMLPFLCSTTKFQEFISNTYTITPFKLDLSTAYQVSPSNSEASRQLNLQAIIIRIGIEAEGKSVLDLLTFDSWGCCLNLPELINKLTCRKQMGSAMATVITCSGSDESGLQGSRQEGKMGNVQCPPR